MKKVRLGLVGCGNRGRDVAGLFNAHPACQVTALMDLYPQCLEKAVEAMALGDVATFTDFDKLLRDAPVDALLITCDPMQQADLACRAMEAGRHACTEVPAAFSLDELWRLVQTVEKTGCKYQLMEQTRYWGFVGTWRQMHQRGELGHVCFAQGEYIHFERRWNWWVDPKTGEFIYESTPPKDRKVEPTWRQKCFGDPIYYLPHTLSPLLKILDDRVVKVSCMGTRKDSYTFEGENFPSREIEYALMHTAGDTVMAVGAGFSLPYVGRGQPGCHWYELRGTKGSVESPRCKDDPFRKWHPGMDSYEGMDLSTVPLDADEAQAKTGHGGADFKPVDAFVNAIINDTTPALDVYLTAELTAPAVVAAESARRGGELLKVPDFRGPRP